MSLFRACARSTAGSTRAIRQKRLHRRIPKMQRQFLDIISGMPRPKIGVLVKPENIYFDWVRLGATCGLKKRPKIS